MSEQTSEVAGETAPQEGGEQEVKTFDAEYVDKLRKEAAKYRTEAKTNSEAAKRLAAIEEANKSEADKSAERLAKAEQDAADARRDALRYRVATEMQLSDEDVEALSADTSTEEGIRLIASRLSAKSTERKKSGNHVPREGNTSSAADTPALETVRGLFGS